MKDIKYQYAYDESNTLVSIKDYTKESSKLHTFKCIVCGGELRPRAIDSKHRRAHFITRKLFRVMEKPTYINLGNCI